MIAILNAIFKIIDQLTFQCALKNANFYKSHPSKRHVHAKLIRNRASCIHIHAKVILTRVSSNMRRVAPNVVHVGTN